MPGCASYVTTYCMFVLPESCLFRLNTVLASATSAGMVGKQQILQVICYTPRAPSTETLGSGTT